MNANTFIIGIYHGLTMLYLTNTGELSPNKKDAKKIIGHAKALRLAEQVAIDNNLNRRESFCLSLK
jgi:hypothetical protein